MDCSYLTRSTKVAALEIIENLPNLRLFNKDLSCFNGCKEHIVSSYERIYRIIYRQDGTIDVSNNFLYDYIEHGQEVSFVVDFDIKNKDGTKGPSYDAKKEVIHLIRQINCYLNEKFGLNLTFRDWLVTHCGYFVDPSGKKVPKHSFHAKLVRRKLANIVLLKDFAQRIHESIEDPYDNMDLKIYRVGAFRLTGCTKKGRRMPLKPFELVDDDGSVSLMPGDFADHYEYWLNSTMTFVEGYELIDLPEEMRSTSAERLRSRNSQIVDIEVTDRVENHGEIPGVDVLQGFVDCLDHKRAEDYQSWLEVAYALCRSITAGNERQLYEMFLGFSMKSIGKFEMTVTTAEQWESCKRGSEKPGITCGSLFHWAKEDKPDEYRHVIQTLHLPPILLREIIPDYSRFPRMQKVISPNGVRYERTRELTPDDDIFDYYEYHQARCEPYPFHQYKRMLVLSSCGSGKTYQTTAMLTAAELSRILKLSPRILFTKEMITRYSQLGIEMETYFGKELEFDLSGYPKFIISPESCFRIKWNRKYDFFDGDEIEMILRTLSSEKTMHNLAGSAAALVDFLTFAEYMVLSDAHLSSRTIDMVRAIFGGTSERILIMRNTMQIMERKVKHYVQQSKSPADTERYQDYFIDLIIADLRAGKNVGVHSNSKGFTDRLTMAIDDEHVLHKSEYLYLFGEQGKEGDIDDLNTAFRDKRMGAWTPALTIGNSYDEDNRFHCQYAYLTCKSTNACVAVQACQRIRELQDNTLHLMIDDVPNQSCKLTFDDVKQSLEDKRDEIADAYRSELERRATMSREEFLEIQQLTAGDAVEFQRLITQIMEQKVRSPALQTPEILFNTLAWNALENNISMMHYTAMLYFYLRGEGYKKFERVPVQLGKRQDPVPDADGNLPVKRRGRRDVPRLMFAEIADLNEIQFKEIDKLKKRGQHTAEQLAALEKFQFVKLLVRDYPVSVENQATLFDDYRVDRKHKEWIFNAYNYCRREASKIMEKDISKTKYLEVVRVDGAVQSHMKSICTILGLKHIHDTDVRLSRESIEDSIFELSPHLKSLRVLTGKAEKAKEDFRSATDVLRTLFKELYGMKFENSEKNTCDKKAQGPRKKAILFALSYVDSFAQCLYTCGLV